MKGKKNIQSDNSKLGLREWDKKLEGEILEAVFSDGNLVVFSTPLASKPEKLFSLANTALLSHSFPPVPCSLLW